MAVAVYARISQDREGAGVKTARQVADCRRFAKERGWPIAEVFTDDDRSASNGKPRPGYQQLLAAVEAGAVDRVVTWHLDRLYRRPRELEDLIALVEDGKLAGVWTVTGGDFDLNTSDGRAMARVVTTFARKESEELSRRVRRAHEELAEQGRNPGGGRRAFGWLRRQDSDGKWHETDEPHPDEARLICEAAQRVIGGESLYSITHDWASRGITTPGTHAKPSGNLFTASQLRKVLTNPRNAGIRTYQGEVIGDATWPPILDRSTFEQVRAVLLNPTREWKGQGRQPYLLTGLLRCAECGGRLRGQQQRHYRAYACKSEPGRRCGRVQISADRLDPWIIDAVMAALDSDKLTAALEQESGTDEQRRGYLRQLDDDEAALEQLAKDFYTDRLISRREFLAARRTLEQRISKTRRALERLAATSPLADLPTGGEALRKAWEAAEHAWRRKLLALVVERIEVGRAAKKGQKRFAPDRVRVIWRV